MGTIHEQYMKTCFNASINENSSLISNFLLDITQLILRSVSYNFKTRANIYFSSCNNYRFPLFSRSFLSHVLKIGHAFNYADSSLVNRINMDLNKLQLRKPEKQEINY